MPRHSARPRTTSAKRAGGVTVVGQLAKAIVQFVSLIVFSHLLTPRDVGLIGMLVVFVYLGELVRDFGLSQAAMQTPKLTQGQASNLFWTNVAVGGLMTVCLCVSAPLVAQLFHEPALQNIAPWVAATFTVNALQTQFQVRLARDHRFLALTATDVASQIVGLAAGVTAAMMGAGYWSLVVQMLFIYTSLLTQRVVISGWWPGRPRREPGMSTLYSFGVHSGLAQLVQYAASNVDSFTIGIRLGANALGVYNRAFQMFSAPSSQLLSPLTNVALPLLSRRRHEGGNFYPLLWKAQVVISAALTLVFVLAASLAEPMVRLALGPDWRESAPLLSILSIGGAAQALSYMAFWAFLASANTRQLFLHSLVTKPLLAACIVTGSIGGLQGVAWGFSLGLVLSWFISLMWLRRCDAMPAWLFLRSGVHVLACGLIAGGATWLFVGYFDPILATPLLMLGGLVLATTIYVSVLLLNGSVRRLLIEIAGPVMTRVKAKITGR